MRGRRECFPVFHLLHGAKAEGSSPEMGRGWGGGLRAGGDERELLQKKMCLKHQNTILLKKVKSVFIFLLMFCPLVLEIPLSLGLRG